MKPHLLTLLACVTILSACSKTANNAVFSNSSDSQEALAYIGATPGDTPIRGKIISNGEYFEFAEEVHSLWVSQDSVGLKNLLSQSTLDMFSAAGEGNMPHQWGAAMSVHLLKGNRDDSKVFVALIEDLESDPMFVAQKEWFTFPEAPTAGLILYSYDEAKKDLFGRLLYPVKRDGKM